MKVERILDDKNDEGNSQHRGQSSLIVKNYGGNIFNEQASGLTNINSPMVQSLIFYEQAKRGWGPKLYGLTDGGRVEEFIDCHTLTGHEAFETELNKDMARAYARFHSLKLPLRQENCDILTTLLPSVAEAKAKVKTFLASGYTEQSEALKWFQELHDFPLEEEGMWIKSIFPKVKQRTVLCTMDPNYQNRLVRTYPSSDPRATRTVIIDFDLTCYSDRGFDLGGHFVTRLYNGASKETKVSGAPYPSEPERIEFLTAYLQESEKLLEDFDRSTLDSLDNLLLETELNALVYIITGLTFSLNMHSILDQEPNITTYFEPMMSLYRKLKQEFITKYPKLI